MTTVINASSSQAQKDNLSLKKISDLFKDIEENRHFGEDFFLGRHEVTSLCEDDFKDFLTPKECALVMFYDPEDEGCIRSKSHFLEAAINKTKEEAVYAAVNCVNDARLCRDQKVTHFPFFKLFSKGLPVSTIKDVHNFTEDKMNSLIDGFPAILQAATPKKRAWSNN